MYKDTLSDFLAKTDEYSREYFKANYSYCNQLLIEIESVYGNSIWLIENKINLFNVTDKETSEGYYETLQNSELNSFYKFLNWILHIKSDELVSPARFEIELQRMVQTWSWVKKYNLSDFLLFHFSIAEDFEDIDLNSLLNVLENLSLIDRYFTLLKITENLIDSDIKKVDDAVLNKAYNILYSIYPNNLSPYYRILKNDYTETTNEENAMLILALNSYSQGNYDDSIAICEEILQTLPYEIGVYEIYAKSLLVKDINNLEDSEAKFYIRIINLLLEIYSTKNREVSEEKIDEILKICIAHNTNKWAWKLLSLITNQKYGMKIFESIPIFKKGFKYSSFLKPQILSSLFKESYYQDQYIELNFYPESITYKIHKAYSQLDLNQIESLDIEENRKHRLLGNIYLLKKDYQEALKSFNKISSDSFIYKPEIFKGKINSYIGLENFEVALNLLIDSYLEEYEVIHDIDLIFMYESLLEEEYSYSNINILIFVELLTRYTDHNLEIRKHNFLEDFLVENDVNLISEMTFDLGKYPKEKLIFVLKEYCTIDNMSQYYYFETYEQVEEERIKICRILTQIDPDNKNDYSEEIRDLNEKSQIRVHTAALEKSKIYVDTEGIKKQALSLIDNNFNRITEYFSSSKSKGLPVEFYFNGENEKDGNTFKRNSYSEIYNEMIFQLRDTFIFSKQYGLNVYLSLGIRHGTIIAQFRKLFEKDYFLTLFNSYENKYKVNQYWLEKLNVNQSNRNHVISAFNSFNKNIDDLLNLLKDAKLQISTDLNDTIALFNYYIKQVELIILYAKHVNTENLTIDTFIDQIIEMLWEYTERNLNVVREYLNTDFKYNLLDAINSFIIEIEEINKMTGMQLNLQEFNNKIIDLRTEIEYQIKHVSNWFTKENIVDIDNFTLELPVNIALEYIKSSNFNISIDSTIEINTNKLKVQGKYLKWFNELFYAIFDNIVKRSGFHNEFKFELEIKYESPFLKIECINPINLDAQEILNRREVLKDKLSEINYISTHEESNILARASEEGGSGLYKIVKVLRYDIKTPTFNLDFGIDDDENYFIYISLDTRGIIFEDINS
ncbi:hypothetical protein BGM26_09585 [Bacillus sp. FJAT-29790]|uniref:hypothetical protein n=1 Tax=Bacillus sp. FJAT-29790 TaxID=1895002 RepID=UPI001C229628|nr:hypothetical protein [Bacillus sp. FJAT-29790]MBU8879233.1 hypothetical protein [Bacillus sp. FJAT-29790]